MVDLSYTIYSIYTIYSYSYYLTIYSLFLSLIIPYLQGIQFNKLSALFMRGASSSVRIHDDSQIRSKNIIIFLC